MVDFELYKLFYAIAKHGNLGKAAEELFVSQPAASQSLKQLETLLSTPLFNRVHHGMELSAQGGKIIFDDVEQAVKLLNGVEEKLAALKQNAVGKLRIGASETIFQYVLSEKIVRYNKLYPRVEIELISDVSPKIISLLKRDECDVGFLNLPVSAVGVKIKKSIAYLNDVFIAGESFSELKGKTLSVSDLTKYPLLLMGENTVSGEAVRRYALGHGVELRPAVEVGSWGFMKHLVMLGMGIGCLPREYSLNKLSSGAIFELSVDPPLSVRSVGMALPETVNMTFALQAFLNLFS